jgi:hypothetical protein
MCFRSDEPDILIHAQDDILMLQAATIEQTASCPKCDTNMVLAAITPHPVSVAEAARERQVSMPGKDALFAKEEANGASEQTRDGEQQQSPID